MVGETAGFQNGHSGGQIKTTSSAGEAWTSASQKYLNFMQSLTMKATTELVREAATLLPFTPSSRVLDNGCGSGSLTVSISDAHPLTPILATDVSQGMLDLLAGRNFPNVRTRVADAMDMSTLGNKDGGDGADERYSHVLSSFMVQFTPEPYTPIKEMFRLLQRGGVCGLGVWGLIEYHGVIKDVAYRLDPSNPYKPGINIDWPQDAAKLKSSLIDLGFVDVQTWCLRMEVPQSNEELIEYTFEGGNPIIQEFLQSWRDAGKVNVLREELTKALNASKERLGVSALLAVARKPE